MDRITEFAAGFIPENLPKKKAQALREEIICHLLDKADYYKDIGYDESVSIDKAIEEFGTDKNIKEYIRNEFEELYRERTVWGILAGALIIGLNILCFPLDLWVASFDSNRDPDPLGAFMSFLMIFVVVGFTVFARIKKYRKMLLSVGLFNLVLSGFFFWCFYPQMALFSVWYNLIYLIDNFTPFIIYNTPAEPVLLGALLIGVPLMLSIYPIAASILLKLGKIGDVKNQRKKSIAVACVCFSVMFVTCMLQKTGFRYYDEYPIYFSPYDVYISDETEDVYNRISLGDTVEQAEKIMDEYAILPMEKYRSFLDKVGQKQLDKQLREMDFDNSYRIYFPPYSYIKGQGLVGIREENGIVTGVAVGNIDGHMYNEKSRTFGYSSTRKCKSLDGMMAISVYLGSLKPGDGEEEILSEFGDDSGLLGEDMGMFYSMRKHLENGMLKTYYRVYFYGVTDPESKVDYKKYSPWYLELSFVDGALEKGALYTREYTDDDMYPKKLMTIG